MATKNNNLYLKLLGVISGYNAKCLNNNKNDKIDFLQNVIYKEIGTGMFTKTTGFVFSTKEKYINNNILNYNAKIIKNNELPKYFSISTDDFLSAEFSNATLQNDSNEILSAKIVQWANRLTKHFKHDIEVLFSESNNKYSAFYNIASKTPNLLKQTNPNEEENFEYDFESFIETGLDDDLDKDEELKNEFDHVADIFISNINNAIKQYKKYKNYNITKHEIKNFLHYSMLRKLQEKFYQCKALEIKNILSKENINKSALNFFYIQDVDASFNEKTHTKVLGILIPGYSEPIEVHISDDIFDENVKNNDIPQTTETFDFKPGIPHKLTNQQLNFLQENSHTASKYIKSIRKACGLDKLKYIDNKCL